MRRRRVRECSVIDPRNTAPVWRYIIINYITAEKVVFAFATLSSFCRLGEGRQFSDKRAPVYPVRRDLG
jgi:hypothetical protein